MTKHTIITIGRQFGSGGHEVGKRLSDRLGIPLYDRNLIQMAAKELGVTTDQAVYIIQFQIIQVLEKKLLERNYMKLENLAHYQLLICKN